MRYRFRVLRPLSLATVFVGLVSETRSELSSTSPFLPPQSQVVAPPAPPPTLEFRGMTTIGDVTTFSVFDSSSKKTAAWLKLNEPGPGFTVKNYDPGTDTITVD